MYLWRNMWLTCHFRYITLARILYLMDMYLFLVAIHCVTIFYGNLVTMAVKAYVYTFAHLKAKITSYLVHGSLEATACHGITWFFGHFVTALTETHLYNFGIWRCSSLVFALNVPWCKVPCVSIFYGITCCYRNLFTLTTETLVSNF